MSAVLKSPGDVRPLRPTLVPRPEDGPAPPAGGAEADPGRAPGSRRHKGWRPGPVTITLSILVLAIVIFLLVFQWNWLRGPIGRYASAQTGRLIRLDGDLKVHLFSWTPRVDIGGLKIGNPAWGPRQNMAEIENVTVEARLLPLITGHVELPLVAVRRPNVSLLRDAQGRANWDFSRGAKKASQKPLKLPPIQDFIIEDGRLRATDVPRKLTFAGTVNAHEQRAAAYDQGFRLTGKGELNRKAFDLDVTGGPLINVRADRPYPFDALVTAGGTRVTAKGQVPKPFDLGVLDAQVSVQGQDLNQLYDLTGLALPNTPPYRVSGRLHRNGQVYTYDGMNGRIGASDIGGDLSADVSRGRPFLQGKLHSRLLDFADLAGVFGLPGASKAAAPAQKAAAQALAAKGRILPDATLQVDRIRSMDAKVTYTAAQVRAPGLPLKTVSLGVDLDHGVLKLDPVAFTFPSGRLAGTAGIDARKAVPVSNVDMRVSNIRLEEFMPVVAGSKPLSGGMLGRARLTGTGDSVHKAAASSDGAVTVVIPRGQMRQAFAELLGIDATKGLFLLLGKSQQPTDVRCALADFKVAGGVLTAQTIVFDTGVVLVNGAGTVNLDTEKLDLVFKGKNKKFRLVRVIAPLTVGGSLRAPKFGVQVGAAVAQAGIGAVLGATLSPLAAILPFIGPGLEKDADCAGLFAQARQGYAPVAAPQASLSPPSKGKAAPKAH